MSLWDKWENDKRRAQGLPAKHDVEYHDSHLKHNFKRDILILLVALVVLGAIAAGSIVVESAVTGKKWSDTAVIQLLASRGKQRAKIMKEQAREPGAQTTSNVQVP